MATLGNFIRVTNELNRQPDVACPTVCTDPYGPGGTGSIRGSGRGDGLCTVSPGRTGTAFGGLALVGVAFAFGARRRRRK